MTIGKCFMEQNCRVFLQNESSTIGTEVKMRSTKHRNADKVKSLVSLYNVVTGIIDSCMLYMVNLL